MCSSECLGGNHQECQIIELQPVSKLLSTGNGHERCTSNQRVEQQFSLSLSAVCMSSLPKIQDNASKFAPGADVLRKR